ncbi:unnamed protein product [Didymodactylos carnosus]|uniref:Integrase catalytic domain-containing protein n=1 Tax=Didymodactylos carnosus TaxID=1234261 RepID=A0A814VSS9_9BILA|nr:unnamed protein product [Didymodactylos carnosus]CAF1195172.1 unnamed protein product [Didymodactylos carnosus]CAF3959593.1 unnamed protein product [Didymodactylos carnosus]CAF3960264.1 unnamed protein product [Didymodactylos carnosus]
MTNGQTERFNATFSLALAELWDEEANNWNDFVPTCVYAYNTGEPTPTSPSPFQLMFGRRSRLTIETKQPKITQTEPLLQIYSEIKKMFSETYKSKYHNQLTKKRYDQNKSNPKYSIDQLMVIVTDVSKQDSNP